MLIFIVELVVAILQTVLCMLSLSDSFVCYICLVSLSGTFVWYLCLVSLSDIFVWYLCLFLYSGHMVPNCLSIGGERGVLCIGI